MNRALSPSYLLKYMRRTGEEWEVIPELKRMCRFYRRNLCDGPMLLEKYDGRLLRNVMLYFSIEKRRQLLLEMHSMLPPDGFLILRPSEQPDQLDHFQAVLAANTCYYRPLPSTESADETAVRILSCMRDILKGCGQQGTRQCEMAERSSPPATRKQAPKRCRMRPQRTMRRSRSSIPSPRRGSVRSSIDPQPPNALAGLRLRVARVH